MSHIPDLTIREAGALLRSGNLSAVELTEGVLDRLAATEPVIHAYVHVSGDEAMSAARTADSDLRAGRDRGPLHGIPVAVKDLFDVAGAVTGCGSRVREDARAAGADATAVACLRDAGAILVGKTVTHEFAAGVISPPTRNPWAPARIPGGSSGGSAAAVAAGSCLGALSSDTAGSIRVPASLCGVVGVKPTRGRVNTLGAFPLAWSVDTVGTHAKTVDDAMLMLQTMASTSPGRDADTRRAPAGQVREDLRGLRLGVARPYFFDRLQRDVDEAVAKALALLADLGAEVIETPWREAQAAAAAGFIVIRSEMAAVHSESLRAAPEKYGPVLRARLEGFSAYPAAGYLRARRARTAVRRAMAQLFAAHHLDALVEPTTASTAPPADHHSVPALGGEDAFHGGLFRLTVPFNTTGQPAVSVPCGFDAAGLPIGLQFVGSPWGEHSLACIVRAYELAAGWSSRRPSL